jgi:hypothetical protein
MITAYTQKITNENIKYKIMDLITYSKHKNSINRTLHKLFGDNFVKFKDISFPGDFDKDLVHFSLSGMKKYFFRIRSIFLGSKCNYVCYKFDMSILVLW